MNRLVIAAPVICISVYLTVAALDPNGESFIGRRVRRRRELAIGPKEDHRGHEATTVVLGKTTAGERYP